VSLRSKHLSVLKTIPSPLVVKNPFSIVGLPQDEQYRPINRHINHLPGEMGDYLTELNAALIMFVDVGMWNFFLSLY
jgi:hypothetical protein